MFGDREKALILKVLSIQVRGKNGSMVPIGSVYIKRALQYFAARDDTTRSQIWERMSEGLCQMDSFITTVETRELNTLLREKCEESSPQEVKKAISALVRKAAKRGGATIAL